LQKQKVAFHLYLVGEGPLRARLETAYRGRGLSEVVSFVGMVLQERLPDWYRAADLTVLPSRSEGVPNVLRESLACGTPFVASRVGGIPELAHDPANRLVPPDDPEALAEALQQVLRQLPRLTVAPGQFMGWDESAEALMRVLTPLVTERQRGPQGRQV
jgi:glycosyltransferase involved in cell wall biosynthesis